MIRIDKPTSLMIACALIVGVASFFGRQTGACGTGHYLLTRLIGGTLISIVDSMYPLRYGDILSLISAVIFNMVLFLVPASALRIFVSGRYYSVVLFAWTALFLASYFFFFPTRDCP